VDEGGRHHHELPGDVEAQLPHQLEILHVLTGDRSDGDVVDVDLLAPDEIEEEVQWPLEEGELDPGNVRGQGRLDALRHRDPLGSLLPFPGLARRVRLGRLGRRPGIVAHEPPFR
jgi:hypothetical protein